MSQDALKQYANQIRKKAEDVNDDKYLLAIADAVEKGSRQLSAAIEALIQTRLEHLKLSTAKVADTVTNTSEIKNNTSEIKEIQHAFVIINKRLQLLEIAFQKQTDLFVTLFGITKEAQEILNKSETEGETQPEEPVTAPVVTAPVEQPPVVKESPLDLADTEEVPEVPEGVEEFKPGD